MPLSFERGLILWVLFQLSLLSGCATGTTALWRAGASRVGHESVPLSAPKPSTEVEVLVKAEFGTLEETRSKRHFVGATTTVLRKAYLLEAGGLRTGEPQRPFSVLAHVTTEEFPRDEEKSEIHAEVFSRTFGAGSEPYDLFDVTLDPAFRAAALDRLRYYAGQLGADAVIGVFATGEAEHHMWEGGAIGFDARETSSPLHASGKLLDFRLRDVRLHGLAIRYE